MSQTEYLDFFKRGNSQRVGGLGQEILLKSNNDKKKTVIAINLKVTSLNLKGQL